MEAGALVLLRRILAPAALLSATLWAAPDLAVQRLALHQYEDGPVLESSYEYLPGETAWFSARVTGFSTEPEGDNKRMHLSWKVEVRDPAGVLLEPPRQGEIKEILLKEDRDWVPKFAVDFMLPSFAPAGEYRIRVAVRDELARSETTAELRFRVRGEPIPTATSLGVRSLRFLARETDRFGLQPAIYRPGSTLFARFDIVGYTLGENNRFSVDYGLAILAGERQVFSQPEAAAESGEGFYPQRWVPGGFSLNLDNDVAPGAYTLVVTVRDKLSGQTSEARAEFEVR
jgi:hypothetical protein